jgi:hypothetical protein
MKNSLTYARADYGGRGKSLEVQIDSINLTPTEDNRSHKVKKPYQISDCRFRFRFGEPMLVEIKFNLMQNMAVNNEFKRIEIDLKLFTAA